MSIENESATPAQQETPVEQVSTVEAVSTEATTEQTQGQPEQTEAEPPKKEPWFQKRIGELTREKYEGRREAEQARAEAQALREQLERLQRGEEAEQPAAAVPRDEVLRIAKQLNAEERFNEACNRVYAEGKSEFPDFDASVANLQMVGLPREVLVFTTTSDAGAKLLHHLGKDLDEAARIAALPSVLMARELTKLELKLSQPKEPKPVSKAPAPITPIAGTSGGSKSPSEMTDDEFAKWRKSQIASRL
jgi:hypothetical protein